MNQTNYIHRLPIYVYKLLLHTSVAFHVNLLITRTVYRERVWEYTQCQNHIGKQNIICATYNLCNVLAIQPGNGSPQVFWQRTCNPRGLWATKYPLAVSQTLAYCSYSYYAYTSSTDQIPCTSQWRRSIFALTIGPYSAR